MALFEAVKSVFEEWVIAPLHDEYDDELTLHRKRTFAASSFLVSIADLSVVIIAFIAGEGSCGLYLGLTAIFGLCLTLSFYAFCRLQQYCGDLAITLQFFHSSVRAYIFTIFLKVPTSYAGAVGACAASLLYVACRVPPRYHVFPLVTLVLVFALAIADVNYNAGPSSATCSNSDVVSFLVTAILLFNLYAMVMITSLTMFLVSFTGDDMKGFFALRMADVVLSQIAILDLDGAAHVLAVSKADVTEDMHRHFQKMVRNLQRYKEYLPTALFNRKDEEDGGVVVSGDEDLAPLPQEAAPHDAERNPATNLNPLLPPSSNGLATSFRSANENIRGDTAAGDSADNVPQQPLQQQGANSGSAPLVQHFSGHSSEEEESGMTPHHPEVNGNREFSTRRGTVMRISFSVDNRHENLDETIAFRYAMELIVVAVHDNDGEIEEATSTFVLVSFGARFTLVTHEQIAADCAITLQQQLSSVFRSVYVAIASGPLNVGTFSADDQAWLVIGGAPVELVAKMNSLQEQIKSPVLLTNESASRCQHHFVAVELMKAVGFDPLVVFEMSPAEISAEVKEDMLRAFVELQRNGKTPEVIAILQKHEASVSHAKRLLRILSHLGDNAPYRKDEIPWVADMDEPLPVPKELKMQALLNTTGGGGLDQSGTLEGSFSSISTAAWKRTNNGTGSQFGGQNPHDVGATFYEDAIAQSWSVSHDSAVVGRTSTVSVALGSSGTLAAALIITNISDDIFRDVFEVCFKFAHPNVIRVLGTHTEDAAMPMMLLTDYYPQGSIKSFITEYGLVPPKTMSNFLRDIVRGLVYLTTMDVIHGCLRPSCILQGEDGSCAVTKYGFSPPHEGHIQHRWYAAPELMLEDVAEPLTPACDVWSLGITIMEMLGAGHPLKELCRNDPERYPALLREGIQQTLLEEKVRAHMQGLPRTIVDVVVKCLVLDRDVRPMITAVQQMVDSIVVTDDQVNTSAL